MKNVVEGNSKNKYFSYKIAFSILKKVILIILFSSPLISFSQYSIELNYSQGEVKITEKSWIEKKQTLTSIESIFDNGSNITYYINENGIELGLFYYPVKVQDKYLKLGLSLVNESDKRFDFIPENIEITVDGDIKTKEKYDDLIIEKYNSQVKRKQFWRTVFVSSLNEIKEINSAYKYADQIDYSDTQQTPSYILSYSPALLKIQRQQNKKVLNKMLEEVYEDKDQRNNHSLKSQTLFPNASIQGYVLIPVHKKITDIDFKINIEGKIFDFSNSKFH